MWRTRIADLRPVGSGTCGTVYRARLVDTDLDIAIKEVPIRKYEDYLNLQREVRVMRKLSGGDIVRFVDIAAAVPRDPEAAAKKGELPVCLIMIEAADGNLYESVLSGQSMSLPEQSKLQIMVQVLRGLKQIADKGYVHRDIKPENVLVFGDISPESERGFRVKIGDLGLAIKESASADAREDDLEGSIAYIAPEVWAGAAATSKSDLWAAGVVLFELFSGDLPSLFYEVRFASAVAAGGNLMKHPLRQYMPQQFDIMKDEGFQRLELHDPELAGLLARCLARKSGERATVMEALEAAESLARSRGVIVPHDDDDGSFAGGARGRTSTRSSSSEALPSSPSPSAAASASASPRASHNGAGADCSRRQVG